MATKTGNVNNNLHAAKRAKNDEFYTRIEDIEAEVRHYHDPVVPGSRWSSTRRNPFQGKDDYPKYDEVSAIDPFGAPNGLTITTRGES